jgi:hypothetical protein
MTEPTQDPRSTARVSPAEIAERRSLEKITRTFRGGSLLQRQKPGAVVELTHEYRARAVLSYHRFLGRWTAP